MTDTRLEEITDRIVARSAARRGAYLDNLSRCAEEGPNRGAMACGNLAHAVAVGAASGKRRIIDGKGVHIAIVTTYNDMLSAHQPYARVPDLLKAEIRAGGGTAQVVGDAPAMYDGVTQSRAGLVEDGVHVSEITLRSEAAPDCIRAVAKELPGAIVGAGTILTPDQASAARDAGAQFGVSPGLITDLSRAVLDMDWFFLPGIAMVSEAMTALDAGFRALKFFSAEASGGCAFLRSVDSLLPDLRFYPTGGIAAASADDYLAVDNVFAVGGSWLQK